jgi:hypothetical protein
LLKFRTFHALIAAQWHSAALRAVGFGYSAPWRVDFAFTGVILINATGAGVIHSGCKTHLYPYFASPVRNAHFCLGGVLFSNYKHTMGRSPLSQAARVLCGMTVSRPGVFLLRRA